MDLPSGNSLVESLARRCLKAKCETSLRTQAEVVQGHVWGSTTRLVTARGRQRSLTADDAEIQEGNINFPGALGPGQEFGVDVAYLRAGSCVLWFVSL